jgi:hypothetical protein
MWTMQLQQPYGAAAVAKPHQLLAEDLNPQRQIFQLVREANRLPKAPQILAAWCARADMGEFRVFVGHLAVEVSAISHP